MKKDIEWLKNEVNGLPLKFLEFSILKQRGEFSVSKDDVLELIDQLDEPEVLSQELPVIPKFVADWIEEMKQDERPLYSVMSSLMNKTNHEWAVWKSANMNFSEIVARAWLGGYEIEKEKLYIVQLPTNLEDDLIILDADGDIWKDSWPSRYKMTEKRIKEIDERYWPFAVEVAE